MSDSKMGWLSPTGEFYQCEMYEHISMAQELYKAYGGNGCESNADKELHEKGWVSITILTFDPEKAVAMCYIKKMLGTSEAMKARKKAMKAYEEQKAPEHDMDSEEKKILEKLTRMAEEIKRREQNIENRSV